MNIFVQGGKPRDLVSDGVDIMVVNFDYQECCLVQNWCDRHLRRLCRSCLNVACGGG